MKKTIWTLSALAFLSFGFTACGDDEEVTQESCEKEGKTLGKDADGNAICVEKANPSTCELTADTCTSKGMILDSANCTCVSASERKSCKVHADCEADKLCGAKNECVPSAEAANVYRYVRIDDLSNATKGDDPGADIDAIVLVKGDGSGAMYYVEDIKQYKPNEENFSAKLENNKSVAGDPTKMKGKPTSFTTYTNGTQATDKLECVYKNNGEFTYVSLGGNGGFVEVEMGGAIENKDRLDVLEVGGCKLTGTADGGSQYAKRDDLKIQVSVTADASSWKAGASFTNRPTDGKTDDDNGVLSWVVSGL